jgi:ribosomal protein L37AE/L43A
LLAVGANPIRLAPDVGLLSENAPKNFRAYVRALRKPERIEHFNLCPSCGKPMQALHNSGIYECKECRVLVTSSALAKRSEES